MRPLLLVGSLIALWGCGEREACDPTQRRPAWADRDHDGAGDPGTERSVCAITADVSPFPGDCDDNDAAVSPFAVEACNGIDDDCDGRVDEFFVTVPFWPDGDGDGWGDQDIEPTWACVAPEGLVDVAGDCDDARSDANPDADERCNGSDDDCDGLVDDDDASVLPSDRQTWYADDDGDSYGDPNASVDRCDQPPGTVSNGLDCADGAAAVMPGALEICNNRDDDCNGLVDDADPLVDPASFRTFYADTDGDGFGDVTNPAQACAPPVGFVLRDDDCDDQNPAILGPGPWLTDGDGDGAGAVPPALFACDRPDPGLVPPDAGVDCDDTNAAIGPTATEICNGVDDDCDGLTDDTDADLDAGTTTTFFRDADLDGFGGPDTFVERCQAPAGWSTSDLDCDDADADVNPDEVEVCNGRDDDCDALADDTDPDVDGTTFSLWYLDADLDGWGTPTDVVASCAPPGGYVADPTDCDDADPALGAAELWLVDDDLDGFGATALGPPLGVFCTAPGAGSARLSAGLDCDDLDPFAFPGAPEVCVDGVDQDCDGLDRCTLFAEDWEAGAVDPLTWTLTGDGQLASDPALGGWSVDLGGGGAALESLVLDTSACTFLQVDYQVKRGPEAPAVGAMLAARFTDAFGAVTFDSVAGVGATDDAFRLRSVQLTNARAFSPSFTLQFETFGFGVGADDFYLDELILRCE